MPLPRAFLPLRHATFRSLWLATLASNSGMWLQSTAAGWMMTSLDARPLMVSLVQAAGLLPVFLLALPAGALADIVDRRRFLIGAQIYILLVALLLTVLTATDVLGAWGLLALTFLIGIGTAMNFPAWAATTPELVPREDLVGAIALNGIGFNMARAVGPALGGFAIAFAGPEAAFGLNALAFLVLVLALVAWKRPPASRRSQENLLPAMRAGVRYVMATPAMHAAIIRACTFFFFTAAIWGLLPLLVRDQLNLGAESFGLMLGAMGLGAVAAGFVLPALRARLDRGAMVFAASLVASAAMALCAVSRHWAPAALALAAYGAGWIAAGSTTSVAAQIAAPPWVRARAIAIFQLTFFGAMAAGSALAGWLGNLLGLQPVMLGAAAFGALAAVLVRRFGLEGTLPIARGAIPPLPQPEAASPTLRQALHGGGRRVHEVVRYHVDPADRAAFLAAMAEARRVRLRTGAVAWQLLEDVAHPDRWVELWSVEDWADHLREQNRLTDTDRAALAAAAKLHRGETQPEAARYLDVPP